MDRSPYLGNSSPSCRVATIGLSPVSGNSNTLRPPKIPKAPNTPIGTRSSTPDWK